MSGYHNTHKGWYPCSLGVHFIIATVSVFEQIVERVIITFWDFQYKQI